MKPSSRRKYNYFFESLFTRNYSFPPSTAPIDVVIPIIEKDLKVLPCCLQGIRHCVTNNVRNIFIVSPRNEAIVDFCGQQGLVYKNENDILGFSSKDINYSVNGIDRSGWIFQQLLKLSGNICETPYYLVIDADHVLLSPHTFLTENQKTVFYQSKEYHCPYYDMMDKLLGKFSLTRLSFVSHKMLFSSQELRNLKDAMFEHTGKHWIDAILSCLDSKELSCFSEYETYGCFFPPEKRILLPWRNKNLSALYMEPYDTLVRRYGKSHRAVTFPDYKK